VNCATSGPPPTIQAFRSPAAAVISACAGATEPRTNRMSAPSIDRRSREEKTQLGTSA
jgi:hypothetical protein